MKPSDIIEQLAKNNSVFLTLFSSVNEDLISWKPQPEKWSLLEILCHLYDEEREDFRARILHLFTSPDTAFKPIDPSKWAVAREYAIQGFIEKRSQFLAERKNSVDWLRSLKSPQWSNGYDHPKFGRITASILLTNWLAHDYLHIRQITRYHYQFLDEKTEDKLGYAGTW
jgi:hypothetical protein